jgi:hypothetical protein
MNTTTFPPRVAHIWSEVQTLNEEERLFLAKLFWANFPTNPEQDDTDWMVLGLTAFQQDWDNPDDAVYDNWREHYAVSAG